jgi:uncharacterized membrane protein
MKFEKGRFQMVRTAGRVFGWLAIVLLSLTLLTGYGITDYRVVTPLTFGVLNKAVAQRLHPFTEVPLVLLLLAHIGIALWGRRREGKKKEG